VSDPAAAQYRSGLVYGLVAYLWWGLVPLYFAALKDSDVAPWEILAHRITWSLPIIGLLTVLVGGGTELMRVLRSRRLVLVLLASSVFLAVNWLLYICATATNCVTEASLGYYMMPLVNAAFATLFLGEKLRRAHYPALALVALGVAIPFVCTGKFTWLAVALPVTFGFYGLVRKMAPVDSLTGLTVETLLLMPASLGFLIYLSVLDQNHMTSSNWGLNGLIALSGVVTVVPLLTFTLSIRRLPLVAISFIQYLSPTVQMLIAVLWLGERDKLTPETIAAFACVWSAVIIFILDALWQVRQSRAPVVSSDPADRPVLTPRFGVPPSAVRRP
jgi:chloramphenicol-sensitive protein RarD